MIASAEKTHGEKVELTSKKRFKNTEESEALALAELYNQTGAVVSSVKSREDKIYPGKLYSLSTLQNVLGKKFKMSMAESLAIVQKLYEAGYLTYPRTNSEYLATAEKGKCARSLQALQSSVIRLNSRMERAFLTIPRSSLTPL